MSRRLVKSVMGFALPGSLALTALMAAPTAARAGADVGLRIGWAEVDTEVLEDAGKLGGTDLVGIHLGAGTPIFEIEAAGEYVTQAFEFSEAVIDTFKAAGTGDYEDLTFYLTGKLKLFALPAFPLSFYVGGGLNVHFDKTEITEAGIVNGAGTPAGRHSTPAAQIDPGDLEKAIEDVAGESSEAGWHVVGGAKLRVPKAPLSFFIEGRVMRTFEDQVLNHNSVYLGGSIDL